MFYYDETSIVDVNGSGAQDLNDGYVAFPSASNTETLTPGKGYAIFVRGNILTSTNWNVRGPLNVGQSPPYIARYLYIVGQYCQRWLESCWQPVSFSDRLECFVGLDEDQHRRIDLYSGLRPGNDIRPASVR